MNVHIVTVGSRGDIDPLIALGQGLAERGHAVGLVANSEGQRRAEQAGLQFCDLGFSVGKLLSSGQGSAMLQSGSSHRSRTALLDAAVALYPAVGPRIISACTGADAILSTETVHLLSRSIAEKQGVPHIALGFFPYGRTSIYPSFYADTPELQSLSNLETHDAVERYHHRRLLPAVNALRRDILGLPDIDEDRAYRAREACPTLLGYSSVVAPSPPDWPSHRIVTGYWTWPAAAEAVDPALVEFVESGPPPLYAGFGSMSYEPAQLAPLLIEVAAKTGVRIVYATGWAAAVSSRRTDWPSGFFVTPEVPHRWLFPRVIGAVHHGGAGTTGAALSAGTPSLIAWMIVDQVFWASRVEALGAGLNLGNFHRLDVQTLAGAVERLKSDRTLALRAAQLAEHIKMDNGVERAADAFELCISKF